MICRCGIITSRSGASDVNKVRITSKEADFRHYSVISARVNTEKQRVSTNQGVLWTFSMENGVYQLF